MKKSVSFTHKYLDNDKHGTANMINYMSSQFIEGFTFAGFIPLIDGYFGAHLDGKEYCAVHLSTKTFRKTLSDSVDKERQYILSGKSWVAVLYGNDNSSFMKRFDSEVRMHNWFNKLTELSQDDSWLWYNS